ncbi:MAG TPA: hypothetical protein VMC83_22085 [Streptosporangiaceae bacterium]|nr:hypothetical protein [Streptosporangiaceae bacterium]
MAGPGPRQWCGEGDEAPGYRREAGPAHTGQAFTHDRHREDDGDGGLEQLLACPPPAGRW